MGVSCQSFSTPESIPLPTPTVPSLYSPLVSGGPNRWCPVPLLTHFLFQFLPRPKGRTRTPSALPGTVTSPPVFRSNTRDESVLSVSPSVLSVHLYKVTSLDSVVSLQTCPSHPQTSPFFRTLWSSCHSRGPFVISLSLRLLQDLCPSEDSRSL